MGMTDKQFDAFIRESIKSLERALELSPGNIEIAEMIERYRAILED